MHQPDKTSVQKVEIPLIIAEAVLKKTVQTTECMVGSRLDCEAIKPTEAEETNIMRTEPKMARRESGLKSGMAPTVMRGENHRAVEKLTKKPCWSFKNRIWPDSTRYILQPCTEYINNVNKGDGHSKRSTLGESRHISEDMNNNTKEECPLDPPRNEQVAKVRQVKHTPKVATATMRKKPDEEQWPGKYRK